MSDCRACGACCASFRVSFYRGETLDGPDAVPETLIVPITPFRVAMRGTTGPKPRCAALVGDLGQDCACAIYPIRPSPCREFVASWSDGLPHPECDRARAGLGLLPLSPPEPPSR